MYKIYIYIHTHIYIYIYMHTHRHTDIHVHVMRDISLQICIQLCASVSVPFDPTGDGAEEGLVLCKARSKDPAVLVATEAAGDRFGVQAEMLKCDG